MLFSNSNSPLAERIFPIEKIRSTLRRFPALLVSLSVTCASFLVFFYFAAAGWPGSVTSNCYEDYLITPDCFCERLRGDKLGDVWFAQPMNTITNLWFVLVGLLIAYGADTKRFPTEEWWKHNYNLITQDKMYSVVCSLNACLLGAGSSFLHASFTTWGRQLDMIAMYFIGTFSLIYPLLREGHVTKQQAIWAYCFGNLYLIYWAVYVATPDQTRKLFTALVVASWAVEILMVDPEWAKRNRKVRQLFFANVSMFCLAVIQWKASESGGPLCYPESIFQGHSLWHFQSAMGVGGNFLYYLGEQGTPPSKQFIVDNPESSRGTSIKMESASGTQSVSSNSMTESASDTSYESGSESSQST